MTTQLNLQADERGNYEGLSAQFSGPGFSDMRFRLLAEDPARYGAWLAQTQQSSAVLDATRFADLVRPTREAGQLTFGAVSVDAFGMVANQRMTTHWTTKEAL
jgi:cytochrome o ubiquinol oxidase subunit 2